jgi:hypothetical protein
MVMQLATFLTYGAFSFTPVVYCICISEIRLHRIVFFLFLCRGVSAFHKTDLDQHLVHGALRFVSHCNHGRGILFQNKSLQFL